MGNLEGAGMVESNGGNLTTVTIEADDRLLDSIQKYAWSGNSLPDHSGCSTGDEAGNC